jgi:hypothetical protein
MTLSSRPGILAARPEFDTALAAAMVSPGHPVVQNSWSAVSCSGVVDDAEVDAWLSSVFGSVAQHPVLGLAPLTVYSSGAEGCLNAGGTVVIKTEFVVHRGGDSHGHHYTAQLAASPLRLTFFRWSGLVPESSFLILPGRPGAAASFRSVYLRAADDAYAGTDNLYAARTSDGYAFRKGAKSKIQESGWSFRGRNGR